MPRFSPNAAPGLYTSVSLRWLPRISCGMCCGASCVAAISLVTRSIATTVISVPQKRGGLGLALSIFFALLALDAVSGVRQRVETLEADLPAAVVTLSELLGVAIETPQCLVDMPEETTFLAREKKRLLALHRVGALIGHVEGVCAKVTIRALRSRPKSLVVVPKLLQDALSLLEQALLEVLQAFLRHCLWLFAAGCCCHVLTNPLQGDFDVLPIKVERMRRVCSFDFSADTNLCGEHLGGYPLFERLDRVLNLGPGTHGERDAIAHRETQFFPEPLNAAHQLSRESLEPQIARDRRIERGKIARFLLYHQLTRRGAHDSQIIGVQLTGFIPY